MLLLWWPGDWALWSSGEEAETLPELGECMDTGAPTAPDMSMGNHEVVGLRLARLECDMVVNAVEVLMLWDGAAADTAGYEKRSRCCCSKANCSNKAASPPPEALKS